MKLFLSWSGERSKRTAELLLSWIGCVIQKIEPWMSIEIDRGALWFNEIGTAINSVENGIVCLTRENLMAPWILFEAGALAKNFGSQRVCTFLVDLEPRDISDPLAQFNHTLPNRDSIFQLLKTLNSRLGNEALSEKRLEDAFETYWPQFEERFQKILSETEAGEAPPQKSDREILEDVVKSIQKLDAKLTNVVVSQRVPSNSLSREKLSTLISRAELMYSLGKQSEAITLLQDVVEVGTRSGYLSAAHKAMDLLLTWNAATEN